MLIGTAQAHLLRFVDGALTPIETLEDVDGREEWYTPWGDPADVRSIAVALDGTIHVNVHVGAWCDHATGDAPGGRLSTSRWTFTRW